MQKISLCTRLQDPKNKVSNLGLIDHRVLSFLNTPLFYEATPL